MALSTQQQTAVRAIIATDGLDATLDAIRAIAISDKKTAALTALGTAVAVTVTDWTAPAAYVSQASASTLPSVIADIAAAWAAKDQSKLGPLFVQLFGAAKAHLGL